MKALYSSTLAMLRTDERDMEEIAKGAKVNVHWLRKFKQGKFKNPGVNTIEQLHNFLSVTKPSVKAAQQGRAA